MSNINKMENKRNILVFGFGHFLSVDSNMTEEVLEGLSFPDIERRILPVESSRSLILSNLFEGEEVFDYIIGLGQCSPGRLLRIERK